MQFTSLDLWITSWLEQILRVIGELALQKPLSTVPKVYENEKELFVLSIG